MQFTGKISLSLRWHRKAKLSLDTMQIGTVMVMVMVMVMIMLMVVVMVMVMVTVMVMVMLSMMVTVKVKDAMTAMGWSLISALVMAMK